ncbi:ROK family protein [Arthrobacter sp. HLT1-20]
MNARAEDRDMEAVYVVGVDLGGTKIRAGIADAAGTILAERKVATNAHGVDVVDQIAGLVQELCVDVNARTDQVAATGVGAAGVPDGSGNTLAQAPNLSALRSVSLGSDLAERLRHPVVIENDVNVSALGELHYGVGLAHSDFVFVSVGTGIGMGIVAGGRLVRGSSGAAGEIGYLPLGADALAPENHVRGPLEEAVAGDALDRRYQAASGQRLSTREIFTKARGGNAEAIAVLDDEARWVAAALVAVNAILDPEVFVIGGGIGSRKDLLPYIQLWLKRHGASLDIRTSELGHRAPVAGAVLLALEASGTASTGPGPTGPIPNHTTQKGQAR